MIEKTHFELERVTPTNLFEQLDKHVIGQHRAKRVMALAAYNHIKRIKQLNELGKTNLKKSNVLLIGPTGVGKTHLARTMAQILNLPFVVVDATEYTEAGYYGKDVEVMIAELLYSVNMDVHACERGIIFVDEIDKVSRRSGGMRTGTTRDIGGEGVQQAMLKLLEGRKVFVPQNVTQHWNKHDFVEIDTTNILFICAGTYTDLRGKKVSGNVGFSESEILRVSRENKVTQRELTDYGMLPELLGRIPVIVQLMQLDAEDLARILVEPPDSLLNEFKEVFKLDNIELEMSKAALKEIADFAIKRRTGARGLRSIIEEVLHDDMFNAPETKAKKIKITPKTVKAKLESFDSGMLSED